jgi:uncharacterized protein (DUF433 family)
MSTTTTTAESFNPVSPGLDRYIVVRPGYAGGKPHIAGHRIKVQHVAVWHERLGQSAEEIAGTHPGITLAEVYAALAYYHSHRSEIDADIRADEAFVAGLRLAAGPSPLDLKLRERHAQDDSISPG